jgi:hypothetical protein
MKGWKRKAVMPFLLVSQIMEMITPVREPIFPATMKRLGRV